MLRMATGFCWHMQEQEMPKSMYSDIVRYGGSVAFRTCANEPLGEHFYARYVLGKG